LPAHDEVDYRELKYYRARLIPQRMIDPRLNRIDRLVLDAYIDLITVDYVREKDGKRVGLVNAPYGGSGMVPATTAQDIVDYWQLRGARISRKSVQAANRKLLRLGHIVRRSIGRGWIIGIPHSLKWWNGKTGIRISSKSAHWNDLFKQIDTNDTHGEGIEITPPLRGDVHAMA
jgi:hypothetical protein